MREIKFRGKTLDTGKWVCGHYFYDHAFDKHLIREDSSTLFILSFYDYPVDPETVGQYTGLKDKNGKELYEGDILNQEKYGLLKVIYERGGFVVVNLNSEEHTVFYESLSEMQNYSWLIQCLEIIGNIHDKEE